MEDHALAESQTRLGELRQEFADATTPERKDKLAREIKKAWNHHAQLLGIVKQPSLIARIVVLVAIFAILLTPVLVVATNADNKASKADDKADTSKQIAHVNHAAITKVECKLVDIINQGKVNSLKQYRTAKKKGTIIPGFNPITIRKNTKDAIEGIIPKEGCKHDS